MVSERAGIPITAATTGTSISNTWGQYGYQADPWGSSASSAMPAPSYNPYTGQPDYSAAWIEYYRRQGMHEYADMIQQQSRQQTGYAAPTAQAYPAAQAAQSYPAVPSAVAPVPQAIPQQAVVPPTQGYGPVPTQNPTQPQQPQQQQPQQYDYNQWQQWQQWQAYQQAYQQQQPSMGRPMQPGAGVPCAPGPPAPIGGVMQPQ